jgi:Cu/Ag efflux protein CusF
MLTKIGRGLALAAIAAAIVGFAPRVSADEGTPRVIHADSVKVTATVEAIDLDKRTVTLKDKNGVLTDVQVSDKVRNLAQVKKGDKVVAVYREALAYEVFKAGTATPSADESMVGERAKLGDKPAADVTKVQSISATITAIDKEASKVTLKGPEGHEVTVKVRDPKKLDGVSVGDLVQLTYTRALAIAVKPAAAK